MLKAETLDQILDVYVLLNCTKLHCKLSYNRYSSLKYKGKLMIEKLAKTIIILLLFIVWL